MPHRCGWSCVWFHWTNYSQYSPSFLQRFPVFIIILFLRFIRLILGRRPVVKHKLLCVFSPALQTKVCRLLVCPLGITFFILCWLLSGLRGRRLSLDPWPFKWVRWGWPSGRTGGTKGHKKGVIKGFHLLDFEIQLYLQAALFLRDT